jgi:cell wall-associated NlpC family hydrolase
MRLWPALACAAGITAVLSGGCASSRTAPHVLPPPDAHVDTRSLPPFPRGIVQTALALVGAPYRPGGASPDGFDCSGYIVYVFGVHGVRLPRTVAGLYLAASPVRDDRVGAGDLLFFDTSGAGASHVAIALGGGRFIHAPSSRGTVRVESLASEYWTKHYVGARRVRPPAEERGTAGRR